MWPKKKFSNSNHLKLLDKKNFKQTKNLILNDYESRLVDVLKKIQLTIGEIRGGCKTPKNNWPLEVHYNLKQ